MKFKKELAELVKVKGRANLIQIQKELHEFAIAILGELVDSSEKVDYSLIRTLCNWVENAIQVNCEPSDKKVSKKDLVLEEYVRLKGGLGDADKKLVEKYIEDLHNNKDIRKVGSWRWVRKSVSAYLKGGDAGKN